MSMSSESSHLVVTKRNASQTTKEALNSKVLLLEVDYLHQELLDKTLIHTQKVLTQISFIHQCRQRNTYMDKALHHGSMKCSICGATSSGQTQATLPSVIALFSMSDLLSSYSESIKCNWGWQMFYNTRTHKQTKMKQIITSACWSIGTKHEITVKTTGAISWRTWNLKSQLVKCFMA